MKKKKSSKVGMIVAVAAAGITALFLLAKKASGDEIPPDNSGRTSIHIDWE
jgi:hypothetical protein